MSVKTLLFGAGQGSANFMFACHEPRTYIGILDNDTNKHGTAVHGLPVYSPESLNRLEYDEIVITTQWSLEVYQQLTEELGLEKSTIVLPEKSKLKKLSQEPFRSSETLEFGHSVIKEINALAVELSLPVVVDFGTLLGLVRDGRIIPWDDDIDFAAPVDVADQVKQLLLLFVQNNRSGVEWTIQALSDAQGSVSAFLLNFTDPKQSITSFTTSFSLRKNDKGKALHLPSLGMWYAPQKHFEGYESITWQGTKILVPVAVDEYLTFQYGDWHTPKANMQLSDYVHLNSIDFNDVKQAALTAKNIQS